MKLKIIGGISVMLILFIISCESDDSIEFKRYYSSGALVYHTHCQNCHGANGEGLALLIPPLSDSLYLKNNKSALACFIRYGLKGRININNRVFEDNMPANDLSPIQIAQVLTYVGNSFGNKLNTIDIQQTQSDLNKCK